VTAKDVENAGGFIESGSLRVLEATLVNVQCKAGSVEEREGKWKD
jgi:hypothetical protein